MTSLPVDKAAGNRGKTDDILEDRLVCERYRSGCCRTPTGVGLGERVFFGFLGTSAPFVRGAVAVD